MNGMRMYVIGYEDVWVCCRMGDDIFASEFCAGEYGS